MIIFCLNNVLGIFSVTHTGLSCKPFGVWYSTLLTDVV